MGLKVPLKKWLAMGNTMSYKKPKKAPQSKLSDEQLRKVKGGGYKLFKKGGKPNSKPSTGKGVGY